MPQALVGPVPATRVLDCTTTNVYLLEPEALDPELEARLRGGDIFETAFAYSAGFERSVLFLVANDEGIFGLFATPTRAEFLRRDAPPAVDLDEASDDDLDFSMF